MDVIILAGGYAKRMWPLTKETPKPLLPVAGKPMVQYILEEMEDIPELGTIRISTNLKFADKFEEFLAGYETSKDVRVVVEGTRSEGEKLGSVGALGWLIREENITGELLVIGGDNLFEFELKEMLDYGKEKGSSVVAVYDLGSLEKAKLYGIVGVDENNRMTRFEEKPENPFSTLASTACYAFTEQGVKDILRYLDEGGNPDAMGKFIEWLYQNDTVYAYTFSGYWFDIGSLEVYAKADEFFKKS